MPDQKATTDAGEERREQGGSARILVVDDDEAMREVLRERLSQLGFTVEVAEAVADARRRFASEPPDLVLSDVVMGDGTGVDLLDQLAAASETEAGDAGSGGDVPVVLITAHATVDLSVEAMKKGASDFLTKPLDYDKLRATLDANLHELRSRRRQRRRDETHARRLHGVAIWCDEFIRQLQRMHIHHRQLYLRGTADFGQETLEHGQCIVTIKAGLAGGSTEPNQQIGVANERNFLHRGKGQRHLGRG